MNTFYWLTLYVSILYYFQHTVSYLMKVTNLSHPTTVWHTLTEVIPMELQQGLCLAVLIAVVMDRQDTVS